MNKRQREFLDYSLEEEVENEIEASRKRNIPIQLIDVDGESAITVIEKILLRWKPRDLRLEYSYSTEHAIIPTDDQLLVDLIEDMKFKTVERLPAINAVRIGVYAQNNLSEFERYDHVAQEHNEAWESMGSPEDLMDPVTAEIKTVKDGYVRPADYDGPNPFRESDGPMAKARPTTKRACLTVIEFRLKVDRKTKLFTLGYIAKDKNDRVIYFNEITNKDLTALSRRAIQEMFGNNLLKHYKGPFYEGAAKLFNGSKIVYCKENNQLPWWLCESNEKVELKNATGATASSNFQIFFLKMFGYGFRYVAVPLLLIIGVLGSLFHALMTQSLGGTDVTKAIFSVILMYVVSKAAAWMLRRSYDVGISKKFI